MELNPKLSQYFEKLKNDFQELASNPNPKQCEIVKGDIQKIMSEIEHLNI